jgi:hypothetical protein
MLENHYLETISQKPKNLLSASEWPTVGPKQGRKYKECHKLIKVKFTLGTLMDLNDEPLPSSMKQSTQPRGKERKNEKREDPSRSHRAKPKQSRKGGKGTKYKVQFQGWALGD